MTVNILPAAVTYTLTSHSERTVTSLPVLMILTLLPVSPDAQAMRRVSLKDNVFRTTWHVLNELDLDLLASIFISGKREPANTNRIHPFVKHNIHSLHYNLNCAVLSLSIIQISSLNKSAFCFKSVH